MSDEEIKEMIERNVEIRGWRRMNDTREWQGIVVSRYPGWMKDISGHAGVPVSVSIRPN